MSFEQKMGKYIKRGILASSQVSILKKGDNKASITTVQSTQIKQVITSTTTTTTTLSSSALMTTTTTTSTKTETQAVKVYSDKEQLTSSSINDKDCFRDKEIFTRNEMVIIKALIYCNKANNEPNITNFIPRSPNYSNKDNSQKEKDLYNAIDRLIQNKLIEQQSYSLSDALASINSSAHDNENDGNQHNSSCSYANIDKLINKSKQTNAFIEFIAIKAIMISLINIINERLQKIFNLNFSGDANDVDCDIFNDIYIEYTIMSTIYSFLERDFALSFNRFKAKYEMNFSFKDLFRDIYWDYIFKIRQLNVSIICINHYQ